MWCRCTPSWDRLRNRRGVVTQFTENYNRLISLNIPVNPPYIKYPKPALNEFNIPKKDFYTTKDVCKVLGVKPDTFRNRLEKGYYQEPVRVGKKRRFTIKEITHFVDLTEQFLKDHVFKAGK